MKNYGLLIENISVDCVKELTFSSEKETLIYIDSADDGKVIFPGNHLLKIVRHHDFFFDWFIDDELVEECMVFQSLTDEESGLFIVSTEEISCDDATMRFVEHTVFPFTIDLSLHQRMTVRCEKTSQLSFFFKKENSSEDFKSLTLVFNEKYCKVFVDTYKNNKYVAGERENAGLFKTEIGMPNEFQFDVEARTMTVVNTLEKKEYDLSGIIDGSLSVVVDETYKPDGSGIYVIDEI